jgi:hypothetical protein
MNITAPPPREMFVVPVLLYTPPQEGFSPCIVYPPGGVFAIALQVPLSERCFTPALRSTQGGVSAPTLHASTGMCFRPCIALPYSPGRCFRSTLHTPKGCVFAPALHTPRDVFSPLHCIPQGMCFRPCITYPKGMCFHPCVAYPKGMCLCPCIA